MPTRAVELAAYSKALTKNFGSHVAVDHIDLSVPAGSVFGFLGPNGSGKTTTIKMLLGLIRPDKGCCELFGGPIPGRADRVLTKVGALVEGPAFHPYLSGQQGVRGLRRTEDEAHLFLDHALSGGTIAKPAPLQREQVVLADGDVWGVLGWRTGTAVPEPVYPADRPRRLLIGVIVWADSGQDDPTVLADTVDELDAAVEQAAIQASCETRLLVGQQAQAFVAALPLGRGL